ncbi:MAG: alpha/beta hydrolase [Alphaproteobacteria bacterium]|nr:alpha/beta hydrolase [Alphaproteobacteria bacterium]
MLAQDVKFLSRKIGQNSEKIAYMQQNGRTDRPGLVFLGGFRSDMTGSKANTLAAYAASQNLAYLRFDYFGHGQSSGDFLQGTLSYWRAEVLDILAQLTKGRQILVGSSFGGWLSLMMAEALRDKIAALVLIAPAVDMTHRLMWQEFSQTERDTLIKEGIIYIPSEYDEKGYPITRKLIEDGKQYLMLDKGIAYHGPVRILHGQKDTAVPYALSLELAEKLQSTNVETYFIKDGDHSLSNPENLALLTHILDGLMPTL